MSKWRDVVLVRLFGATDVVGVENNPALIPWVMDINSVCSVLGSILAMCVCVVAGFHAAMALGLCSYLLATASLARLQHQKAAARPIATC